MMPRCVCLRFKMTLEKGAGQGLGLGSRGFALFLHERCVAAVAALCSLSCVVSACALPPFLNLTVPSLDAWTLVSLSDNKTE